jgi:hypothetical protein
LEDRNSKNTTNLISASVRIILEYLEDKATNISLKDLESNSNEKLHVNSVLRKFYAELRKKKWRNVLKIIIDFYTIQIAEAFHENERYGHHK